MEHLPSWFAQPGLWAAAGAVLALWVVLGLITALRDRHGALRDPQRLFTPDQRAAMLVLAGGRCEHKPMLWRRCPQTGSHADHIYPWSHGGVTELRNGQLLCGFHNLSKGGRVPTRLYRWRLSRRRAGYYPPHVPRAVSWQRAGPGA